MWSASPLAQTHIFVQRHARKGVKEKCAKAWHASRRRCPVEGGDARYDEVLEKRICYLEKEVGRRHLQ